MSHPSLHDWQHPEFQKWLSNKGIEVTARTSSSDVHDYHAQWLYEIAEAKRAGRRNGPATLPSHAAVDFPGAVARPLYPRAVSRNQSGLTLRRNIRRSWATPSMGSAEAQAAVSQARPLSGMLLNQHWESDAHRWTFIRHYYIALERLDGSSKPLTEAMQLDFIVTQEHDYQKKTKERERRSQVAIRPKLQLAQLKKWARSQAMNLLDDFEPGIGRFTRPDDIDEFVEGRRIKPSQPDRTLIIEYDTGKPLRIPTEYIDFGSRGNSKGKANDVEAIFLRKHKKSGRYVPFAQYASDSAVYKDLTATDQIGQEDRWMMAVPRLDEHLAPALMSFYSEEAFQIRHIQGLINVTIVLTGARAARGLFYNGFVGLAKAYPLMAGFARAPLVGLQNVVLTAQLRGVVAGGKHAFDAIRRAYVLNAQRINELVIVGAEITFEFAGLEMGVSPSDSVVVTAPVAGVAGAADEIVEIVAKLKSVNQNRVVAVVESVSDIQGATKMRKATAAEVSVTSAQRGLPTESAGETATGKRALDFDSPRMAILRQPPPKAKGKQKKRLPEDPRPRVNVQALEAALGKFSTALLDDKKSLSKKFTLAAREKLANLTLKQLEEANIHPDDLAFLPTRLKSTNAEFHEFVNQFYDSPGFEQVLLSWGKTHSWNKKKKAWVELPKKRWKAFQSGHRFVMKYCVQSGFDPRLVRFEVPFSKSTDLEVPARIVDIVLEGAGTTGARKMLHIEIKSWKPRSVQLSARNPYGFRRPLLRDTAFFGPDDIRWVFDAEKLNWSTALQRKLSNDEISTQLVDTFLAVITKDRLLKPKWGGSDAAIRAQLETVIEVF